MPENHHNWCYGDSFILRLKASVLVPLGPGDPGT